MRSQQEEDRPQAASLASQEALPSFGTPIQRQESFTSAQSFSFGQDGGMSASYSPNRQGGTSTPLPGFWRRADPQTNTALHGHIDNLQGSGQSSGQSQEQSRPSAPTPSRLYIQGSLRSQYALPGQVERSGTHYFSFLAAFDASNQSLYYVVLPCFLVPTWAVQCLHYRYNQLCHAAVTTYARIQCIPQQSEDSFI